MLQNRHISGELNLCYSSIIFLCFGLVAEMVGISNKVWSKEPTFLQL